MANRHVPDCIIPPSDQRCEAMTKELKRSECYQDWRRPSHRCVRRVKQARAGRGVCSLHARLPEVTYCDPEQADNFPHKRFWKWPRKLWELSDAVMRKDA